MTLRMLIHLGVAVALVGAAGWYAVAQRPDLVARILPKTDAPFADEIDLTDASTRDDTSRGTISYLLDGTRWTTFSLPGRMDALRILAHPDVSQRHVPVPGEAFRYGIALEVLDADGAVLQREEHFFRTELITYRDNVDGAEVTARRYTDNPSLPLAVDRFVLGLDRLPDARAVRFRTAEAPAPLTGVNIRVYRPRSFNDDNVSALWDRLPISEKRALAVGYIYPPDLLTEVERLSILSSRWSPFGPVGIEYRDYVSRRLEIYDPPGARVVEARTTLQGGIYLDASRRVGVLLPERFARLQIAATRPDALLDEDGLSGAPITLTAVVEQPFDGRSNRLSFTTDENGTATLEGLTGGRMILSAAEPVWVRVASVGRNDETRVLTEEVPRVRHQYADAGAPLLLAMDPGLDAPTPVRLDLRAFGARAARQVHISLRDAAGTEVAGHVVSLAGLSSDYDRLADAPDVPLSETETVYMAVAPEVAHVEIEPDAPIVAALYMRPVGVARRIDVPEEYFARSGERGDNRSWFGVEARSADGDGRHVRVERPTRASTAEEAVDPDALDWEVFTPLGDWVARRALVPREAAGLSRLGRAVFFQPLASDEEAPLLDPAAFDGPSVLVAPPDVAEGRYVAFADGREIWSATLPASARVSLPSVAGAGRLRIDGPEGARPLVSGLDLDRAGYIERRLLRVAPGEIRFEVTKEGPGREVLAIRLYPTGAVTDRADLGVVLDARRPVNVPLATWSDYDRSFNVRLDATETGAILEQGGTRLGAERRMFMVLGEDVPPGSYEMRLTLDHDVEVLALISRATPRAGSAIEFEYEREEIIQ